MHLCIVIATTTSEDELILMAQDGNLRAFEQIITVYKDYIYSLCFAICKRSDVAEELTQDTFIKVHKNIAKFKGNSSLKTWIYRIAKNTSLSYLRKNQLVILDEPEILSNTLSHAEQPVEENEEHIKLRHAIDQMIPEDKMVLTLFYFDDMKIQDIAEVMSLTENTIKVKLHRARKRLKNILMN